MQPSIGKEEIEGGKLAFCESNKKCSDITESYLMAAVSFSKSFLVGQRVAMLENICQLERLCSFSPFQLNVTVAKIAQTIVSALKNINVPKLAQT